MGYGRETIAIIMDSCSKSKFDKSRVQGFQSVFYIFIICFVWQIFIGSDYLFFFLSSE